MNLRGFYKATGVCALIYAAASLLSYALWISASGFVAVTSEPPSPDRILSLLQLSGNQISARLDILAYFFLIPAGVGLFVFLRDRKPALALTGAAFLAFSIVGLFQASAMNISMFNLAQGAITESLKERLAAINTIAFSYMMPGLWAGAVANLLFGIGLQAQTGAARSIGRLFLSQVAGFLIASGGFATKQDMIGNVGILVQVLAATATFVLLGMTLRRTETEETGQERPQAGRTRAAGASA